MKNLRYYVMSGIVFGIIFVVACAPRTTVTASWTNPEAVERNYSNVLVAVMTDNVNIKQSVEGMLVQELRDEGINATMSLDIFPPGFRDGLVDRDEIMGLINENQYDAIMTVALIDTETETRYVPGRTTYAPSRFYPYYGRFYGYYSHWYPRIYEPGYYTQERTYFYETNLYDAETEELIWSAQSETMVPARAERFSQQFASSIVSEMTGDNIVASVN
jgi:hypothetical protein